MTMEGRPLGDTLFPVGRAAVPGYLKLRGDRLYWSWYDPENVSTGLGPVEVNPKGMLDAFVRIEDSRDVRRFAGRYGVLEICRHGLPASHNRPYASGEATYPSADIDWCYPLGWERRRRPWEPIGRWFHFRRQATALIKIGAAVRQGRRPDASDWAALYEGLYAAPPHHDLPLEAHRALLQSWINFWLSWGGVRPTLDWRKPQPDFYVGGGTFGILALQLMLAVSGGHTLALCTGCGKPYRRRREPQAGRRNYCPNCGEKVAARDRKRAERARRRERNGG